MLTTTATLLFLLVASSLSALAVHEWLGSGGRRKAAAASDGVAELEPAIDRLEETVCALQANQTLFAQEQALLAEEMTRRAEIQLKEGASHEAGLAAAFHESRTKFGEIRSELDQMSRMVAEFGTQIVVLSRACSEAQRLEALEARVDVLSAETPDDLKKIKGIGQVMENTLHDLGISTYEQIANMTIDQIEVLSEQLGNFGHRVERDRWVDQAKSLMAS